MKTDKISFNGSFFHVPCPPHSLSEAQDFSRIPTRISSELKEFVNTSKVFNKLKENQDVYIFHHNTDDLEIMSLFFSSNKNSKTLDDEVCQISMTLNKNKNSSENFKLFENILENNSNISALKKAANVLFPNSKHKLVVLPNNSRSGYCEFWSGVRSVDDTLDKLYAVSVAEIKSLYLRFNNNILNKIF